jgi:hypothetical protein
MIRIVIGGLLGLFLGLYVAVSYPHFAKAVIARIH